MFRLLEKLINFLVGIVEIFLVLRFLLRLFGANPFSPFVFWLYGVTEPLLNPFRGMFPAPRIEGFAVVEFTILVAILIYMLAGYVLIEIIAAIRGATK